MIIALILVAAGDGDYGGGLLTKYALSCVALTLALGIGMRSRVRDNFEKVVKTMALVPLGLGVVVFGILAYGEDAVPPLWFTRYVNFGVVGNTAMMVAVPNEQGAVRGWLCKVYCVLMTVWLLKEMNNRAFDTIRFVDNAEHRDRAFAFVGVPMSWILTHCFYRMALVSLPAFDSMKYVVMEPASMTLMFVLHMVFGEDKGHPIHYYFGYSDTLVAATLAFSSIATDWIAPPRSTTMMSTSKHISQKTLDYVFSPILIMCCVSAIYGIWNEPQCGDIIGSF